MPSPSSTSSSIQHSQHQQQQNVQQHDQSFGMTNRKSNHALSISQQQQHYAQVGSPKQSLDSPNITTASSPSIPLITDFMIHDEDYRSRKQQQQTYIYKQRGSTIIHNTYTIHGRPNVQCAKFCTWFSFIAILFLVFIGILIEVQPLYVKGISAERIPMSLRKIREMREWKNEEELLSYVHYSGRLRMLQTYYIHHQQEQFQQQSQQSQQQNGLKTYDDDPITKYEKYNDYLRSLSDEQKEYIIYEMKSEAKTAFKAAALYFVFMVFSIIYTQNFERMDVVFGVGIKVYCRKLKYFIVRGGGRHFIVSLVNKFRRRNYRDIPDRNHTNYRVRGSIDNSTMNLNKNSLITQRSDFSMPRSEVAPTTGGGGGGSSTHSSVVGDISRNTSIESMVGLSMRERDSLVSGAHFEQQEHHRHRHSLADDVEYKPKKK